MKDWERIQELFLMTVDVPANEQVRLLDSFCAHHPELRAEVESLLRWDCDSSTVIAESVRLEASLLLDLEPMAGRRVGTYRIVREIGRGGMGAVYLASRDDEAFQKQVAIKIVKPGMDTADVLDRFRYERQILAGLEHPYIARLFDGGSTDQGVPFFVMEYVEGMPVNLFSRGHTLNNRDRCELFLKILDAVAYAHRSLVVHRDLKPGNIFVTGDGTPKLLDFGVAKLISGSGEGSHTVTTLLRPFTPEYASPEQVRGLAVTTSTDIYSLGAVFYELLTDRRAQPILTPTPAEIERAICEMEVTRPSQIAPTVDEDLDNIVLMAMRKEPERRYRSVEQFAEDIQRYLDGRPIFARQDSVSYRLRKFLVRNRLEVGAAALLIGGLSAGLAVSLVQTHRAGEAQRLAESQRRLAMRENARATAEAQRSDEALKSEARQRDIAEQQTAIADQQRDIAQREKFVAEQRLADLLDLTDRTLFTVHDAVARLPGSMAARELVVKTTLDYLERLRGEVGLDDDMRLALAAAYFKISLIQGTFGAASEQNYAGAEASLRKGEEVLLPLYQRRSNEPKVMTRWIQIEEALADLDYQAGKDPAAVKIELALLPVAHQLAQERPGDRGAERQESEVEARLANSYHRMPGLHGLEHAERGVSLLREEISRYPDDNDSKEDLASLLSTTGVALEYVGELDEAADKLRQSVQLREELLHSQPNDTRNRRNLIVDYADYASLLGLPGAVNLNRPAEARIYTAKSVALAREIAASDPQDATARYDLGMALGLNGMIDPSPDRVRASLTDLEEAETLVAPIAKRNQDSSTSAYQLENILEFKGQRLETLGQTAEAIQSYRSCLKLLEPFVASGSNLTGEYIWVQEDLARALASSGDFAGALDFANHAVALAEKRQQTSPPSERNIGGVARAYATLAAVQEKAADASEARLSAEHSLEVWKQVHNRGVISIHAGVMDDTAQLLARLNAASPAK